MFVPDEMPLSEQRPTMMMWHGCGSDPEKFEEESEMDLRVGRFQFYNIYPRGSSRNIEPVADQRMCNSDMPGVSCGWADSPGSCQTPINPGPDDIHFAEVILEWMGQNLCVDLDRSAPGGSHCPLPLASGPAPPITQGEGRGLHRKRCASHGRA